MPDEAIEAAGEDLLDAAITFALVADGPTYTLAEVTERTGIPADVLEQMVGALATTAAGSDFRFTDADVEGLALFAAAVDLIGLDPILRLIRVTSASLGRIADAAISAFVSGPGVQAMQEDESGVALLDANVASARFLPGFSDWMHRQLVRELQSGHREMSEESIALALDTGVDTHRLAVGFADLVGSTTHADRRSLVDLSASLDAFERTATQVVTTHGGRVVKFIGDEVMFRAEDPAAACVAAVDLVEAVAADPGLPPLRVGLGYGDVLVREADYHGPVVNVAARVTKLAPMNGVVATHELVSALADQEELDLHPLGSIEVAGVAEPVALVSVSRRR